MKPKSIAFIGRTGSGKSVGIDALIASLGRGVRVSSGDMVRSATGTAWAKKYEEVLQKTLETGCYIPDAGAIELFSNFFDTYNDIPFWITDGFPRTIVQYDFLAEHTGVIAVVYMECNREVATKRMWNRNTRPYDQLPEYVLALQNEVEQKTLPITDHVQNIPNGPLLLRINANQGMHSVQEQLQEVASCIQEEF